MSHKALCLKALAILRQHADEAPPAKAKEYRQQVVDLEAQLQKGRGPNNGAADYWHGFRENQKFQIQVEGGQAHDVTGLKNLSKELSVSVASLRQRFSVGRGVFQMNGRHKFSGSFLTVVRLDVARRS